MAAWLYAGWCLQAARDGLLDVVKAHIDSCLSQINDVDDEGYTAMHYAARYNRVSVMELLFAAGAGIYAHATLSIVAFFIYFFINIVTIVHN